MIMQETILIVEPFSKNDQVYSNTEDCHNYLTLAVLLYTQTSVKIAKINVDVLTTTKWRMRGIQIFLQIILHYTHVLQYH